MIEFIMQPWPWWFSGILVGLTVPLLYFLTGQGFGISTSFQQIGSMCAPSSKLPYFRDFNRRKGMWTLMFAIGIAAGGFIANHFLSSQPVEFLPDSYASIGGAIRLLVGGILIGFGTRYAGGCTSGTRNYRDRKSELAQPCCDDLLLRRRPGSHLGTWKVYFLGRLMSDKALAVGSSQQSYRRLVAAHIKFVFTC